MWLEVSTSNNDLRVVAKYYLDCVRQIGATPSIVRADCGTENVKISGIQRFFRRDDNDSLLALKVLCTENLFRSRELRLGGASYVKDAVNGGLTISRT